jgi:photosystem II stability/assembly factor-like uncharacterized protein
MRGVAISRARKLVLVMVLLLFTALALGFLSVPRARADPGSGWADVTPPGLPSGTPKIKAFDANTAWIYTVSGSTLLKTSDGGQTWQNQSPAGVISLVDLSIVNANELWAVGNDANGPVVLRTGNGGNTWTVDTAARDVFATGIPFGAGSQAIKAVGGASPTTAWVGLAYTLPVVSLVEAVVWKTDNAGATWTLQTTQFAISPTMLFWITNANLSIDAVDAQRVLVGIGFINYEFAQYNHAYMQKSADGGASWATVDLGASGTGSFDAVDENVVWTTFGGLRRTTDGGLTWTAIDNGMYNQSLSAVDANTAWTSGNLSTLAGPIIGSTAKTGDGGQTWMVQPQIKWMDYNPSAFAPPNSISAVSGMAAWAGAAGRVIRTTDGGGNPPTITSVSPVVVNAGDEVTITGTGFGATRETSFVLGITNPNDYVSWTDTQIVVRAPEGLQGKVAVIVETPAGTSNPAFIGLMAAMKVRRVLPNWADTGTQIELDIIGEGFGPNMSVGLASGQTVIPGTIRTSYTLEIFAKFDLTNAPVGGYDVVVSDGVHTSTLPAGFTVTAPSPCGFGSGLGIVMLGLSLGLMSIAGALGKRRKS